MDFVKSLVFWSQTIGIKAKYISFWKCEGQFILDKNILALLQKSRMK